MCLLNSVDFLPISSSISENICQFVCSEVANDCRARSFGQKSLLNQALAAASVVICCVFGCLLVMCSEWKVLPSCRAASFYLRLAPQTRFSRLLNAASLRWFSWFFILGDNSIEMFTSFFLGRFRFFWVLLGEVGNLILADGILWRLNYFTSVRSRLTSAYNNNNHNSIEMFLVLFGHARWDFGILGIQ